MPLRLATLLLILVGTLSSFAEDKPEAKPGDPAAKPATPPPAKKKKKTSDVPPIPDHMSIVDGAKLQEAWSKSETDAVFLAAAKTLGDGSKDAKNELQAARQAAMLRASPSLKPALVEEYLNQSRVKIKDSGKAKKK